MIEAACESINTHHDYLSSRLDLYRMYLDNVRKGGTSQVDTKKKKKKKEKVKSLRFMFAALEQEGVIAKVAPSVNKKLKKLIGFKFTETSPLQFKVEVSMKKVVEINLLDKPLLIGLDELLEMRARHETMLEFDQVTLNVNILVHFLNVHFVSKK